MLTTFGPLVFIFVVVCNAQMVQQCTCDQLHKCSLNSSDIFFKCGSHCQRHASAMNIDHGAAIQCFEHLRGPMDVALECHRNLLEPLCASGPPQQVSKRYLETFKLAFFNRMRSMLDKSGVRDEVRSLLTAATRYSNCQLKCVDKAAGFACKSKLQCGLALPPDDALVEQMMQCAIRSGINTQTVRSVCHCVAQNGVKQVEGICDRIIVQ